MMLLENVEKRITASAILDSDLLQDGVHREEKPLELLTRYQLLEFLTTNRELNPQPTDDLTDNPMKLHESLDMKGDSMLAYHDKLNHRMRGRREDAETATLSPHTVDAPFTTSNQSTVVQATVKKTKPDSLAKEGTEPSAGTPHQLEHYSEVDYNVKAIVDNTCNIMADTDDLGLADFGIINKGLLGQGAFGKVFLVENAQKDQFALKVMQWTTADNDNKIIAERELEVLETLQHQHVVVYVNSFVKEDRMYIITEFCAGGDVGGFLQNLGKATVPEDLLLAWLWQMACGLEYMHIPSEDKPAVLHRDVKPNNIFLTDTGDIRLGTLELPGKEVTPLASARQDRANQF
ncbi:ribosomal protein S6 kinase 2 beta-like isoform X2 [Littorina saxatilis]|uniref:ribosomal protein S6 kinase 2 beta-like isoform X2 n=1 Tax=Littorina saxatilis TaxID=31220 RepID=UPI0038B5FFAC